MVVDIRSSTIIIKHLPLILDIRAFYLSVKSSSLKKGGLKVYDKHPQKELCNVLPKCLYFHPVSHKE